MHMKCEALKNQSMVVNLKDIQVRSKAQVYNSEDN